MKQLIRLFAIVMMVVTMGFATTSCSDDDEPSFGVADYYSECTNVSGGGLNQQDCSSLMNSLNEELVGYYWEGLTPEEAINAFDKEVWSIRSGFAGGMSDLKTPLYITFALKERERGTVIKSSTLVITDSDCTIK